MFSKISTALVLILSFALSPAWAANCDHCNQESSVCGCTTENVYDAALGHNLCVAKSGAPSCSVSPYDSCEKCSTFCGNYYGGSNEGDACSSKPIA